ncbi:MULTISPECIES: MFS transporter [unclassified Mesorhizobium]|uniref:MFS transporter n=1 Tax=unclassified Mesorhizobium TaxID=325217 RepID=UPI000BB07CAB|nr:MULTISPECIES: MFS transporter [unclassified Mesorhizobium]PBB27534.1 MFS transporter [Mesorhizobium sp. WSM4304]PBB77135.1 MFS transporter [Mesorhizobium sp. WSM4308]
MSSIVDCTDQDTQKPLGGSAAGPAGRVFSPGHRWKVLGIGVAANASFSATFSGIPATAVVLRQGYHLSNAELGLALGLLGLGVALSELPWGLLTDRWGDRRVLLIGLGATAAWLLAMAMLVVPTRSGVPDVMLLSASLLLTGLLGGSVNGSSGRAIMGWFRESERGFAMSIRQTAVPLGGGLGALVLPSLALAFGFAAVFALLAGVSALSALFAWRWLHEPPTAGHVVASAVAGPAPLRNIEVWRIATAIGLLCFPQVAVLTFASVFLHDFVGLGTAAISASLAAVQIGAMVMRVWSGRFTDRHGNRRQLLRACSALSGLAFSVLWLMVMASPTLPGGQSLLIAVLPLVLIVAGISVSAWHGVAYTELATLAGAGHVGTALSLANTFVFVGFFLVPVAIPGLLHLWSWSGVWLSAAICALVAWPVFLRPA